jgi:predicted metal-dependent HD superfamily phosphohydrolase
VDLHSRWAGAWRVLGAAPDPALFTTVIAAYSESERHYHTLRHLEECFAHFNFLRAFSKQPAEIELALWFHDAIYDTRDFARFPGSGKPGAWPGHGHAA